MNQTDLAWLAGFTDADGSIALWGHQEKDGRYKCYPTIIYTNTNPAQIEKVVTILDSIGVKMHIVERDQSKTSNKWARSWQVITSNHSYAKIILESILPYLAGKAPQARLTLRYINSRSNHLRDKITEEEVAIVKEVMDLNKRGISKILTDYTLGILDNWNQDIVGTTAKSVEMGRNDSSSS